VQPETMLILVINAGSSSIKFSVFRAPETGGGEPALVLDGEKGAIGDEEGLTEAFHAALDSVAEARFTVDAVGYRVVHPGPKLHDHQRITEEVLRELEQAATFAPLHDPEAVSLIREGMKRFPAICHYACFDTVFHQTMPEEAMTYPIPQAYRDQGVRRYGFHGLSCESILRQLEPVPRRLVIAHLGSGCSVTAVLDGKSVDTTMGLTPTGGVVMGTRPGDLDPGLILYLLRQQKGDAATAVETTLNHEAGMIALSGQPNDMKAIRKAAGAGDAGALLALRVFTRSVTKAIGGFQWLLGGLDAIVFTGGIGEHDATTRTEVLGGADIGGKIAILVLASQEDLVIAMHVERLERG
jgi:acetate kinase